MYLYLWMEDCDTVQDAVGPDSDDAELCIEGSLAIYRFANGRFEYFTPIDTDDLDNWTEVES